MGDGYFCGLLAGEYYKMQFYVVYIFFQVFTASENKKFALKLRTTCQRIYCIYFSKHLTKNMYTFNKNIMKRLFLVFHSLFMNFSFIFLSTKRTKKNITGRTNFKEYTFLLLPGMLFITFCIFFFFFYLTVTCSRYEATIYTNVK